MSTPIVTVTCDNGRSGTARCEDTDRSLTHSLDLGEEQVMSDRTCSIDGCERHIRYSTKGWCNQHYQSWYRYGDPMAAPGMRVRGQCQMPDCDGIHKGRGYCQKHLIRVQKYGDPERIEKPRAWLGANGSENPSWKGRDIGYGAAHVRARTERGPVSNYLCVSCGSPAQQWAYDHGDPDVLIDSETGFPYSPDSGHYLPMCRSCHWYFDRVQVST